MPKIPTQDYAFGGSIATPDLGVSGAQPGNQLIQTAAILMEKANADERAAYDHALAQYHTNLTEKMTEIDTATSSEGMLEGFGQYSAALQQELVKQVPETYQQKFLDVTGLQTSQYGRSVVNKWAALEDQRYLGLAQANLEGQLNAVYHNPSPEQVNLSILQLTDQAEAYQQTGIWSHEQAQKVVNESTQALKMSMANRMLDDGDYISIRHLDKNGFFDGMDPNVHARLYGQALSMAQADSYSSLGEQIEAAQASGEAGLLLVPTYDPEGKEDFIPIAEFITHLESQNLLTPQQASQLRVRSLQAATSIEKGMADQRRLANIMDGNGNPNDPKDQLVIDKAAGQMNFQEQVDLMGVTRITPKPLVAEIWRRFENGTPEEVAEAYETMQIYEQTNGRGWMNDFPGNAAQTAAMNSVFAAVQNGVIPDPALGPDAASRAQQVFRKRLDELSKAPTANAQMKEELRRTIKPGDMASVATSLAGIGAEVTPFTDYLKVTSGGWFSDPEPETIAEHMPHLTPAEQQQVHTLAQGNPKAAAILASMYATPGMISYINATRDIAITEATGTETPQDIDAMVARKVAAKYQMQSIDSRPRFFPKTHIIPESQRPNLDHQLLRWRYEHGAFETSEPKGLFGRLIQEAISLPNQVFIAGTDIGENFKAWMKNEDYRTNWGLLRDRQRLMAMGPDASKAEWAAHQKLWDDRKAMYPPGTFELMNKLLPDAATPGGYLLEPAGISESGHPMFHVQMVTPDGHIYVPDVAEDGGVDLFVYDKTEGPHAQLQRLSQEQQTIQSIRKNAADAIHQKSRQMRVPSDWSFGDPMPEIGYRRVDPETGEILETKGRQDWRVITVAGDSFETAQPIEELKEPSTGEKVKELLTVGAQWFFANVPGARFFYDEEKIQEMIDKKRNLGLRLRRNAAELQ